MQAMKERDDRKPLTGLIQLDDVYWGGAHRGGKHGRGLENKTPFVAVVVLNEERHPMAMNLNVVKGFRTAEIKRWADKHLEPGAWRAWPAFPLCSITAVITTASPSIPSTYRAIWPSFVIDLIAGLICKP